MTENENAAEEAATEAPAIAVSGKDLAVEIIREGIAGNKSREAIVARCEEKTELSKVYISALVRDFATFAGHKFADDKMSNADMIAALTALTSEGPVDRSVAIESLIEAGAKKFSATRIVRDWGKLNEGMILNNRTGSEKSAAKMASIDAWIEDGKTRAEIIELLIATYEQTKAGAAATYYNMSKKLGKTAEGSSSRTSEKKAGAIAWLRANPNPTREDAVNAWKALDISDAMITSYWSSYQFSLELNAPEVAEEEAA